jgi:L-ascorbate metabolism protein UlaG (beta-lactamase superfamily)
MNKSSSVRLIRHATLVIQMGNTKFLVDPMLSGKNEMEPVQNCGNDIRIPMTDLPFDQQQLAHLLSGVAAVVISHTHRDHWDAAAQNLIKKDTPIICQPSDADKLRNQGFHNIHPVTDRTGWEGIEIIRTNGKHGTGEIGKKMGDVSGFIFRNGESSIYLAGDTIWCDDVATALREYNPDTTILNAGGAQFLSGGPITMTAEDVLQVHDQWPRTRIIAVHMDTVNHCGVSRSDLSNVIRKINNPGAIVIPQDGEQIDLN